MIAEESVFPGIRPRRLPAVVAGGWSMQYAMGPRSTTSRRRRNPSWRRQPRRGVSGAEYAYDLLMQDDGTGFIYFPILNYARRQSELPRGAAGAATTASTALRRRRPLRHDLRRRVADVHAAALGARPRRARGIALETRRSSASAATPPCSMASHDRGVLAPGYLADVNVIDMAKLKLGKPWLAFDLPAGGRRLLQKADGYVATIKSGQVTFRDGEYLHVHPGKLIRGPQTAPVRDGGGVSDLSLGGRCRIRRRPLEHARHRLRAIIVEHSCVLNRRQRAAE